MRYLIKSMLLVLCVLSVFTAVIQTALAEDNQTNVTGSPTATMTTVSPTPVVTTPTPIPTPKKFRIGPTVVVRPLNDVIDKSSDGLVEIYMDNPSLNDVTLNADVRISVPSGMYVYGQGFGMAGAAGTVSSTFSVPPGKARSFYMTIKAEKTGDFFVHFGGVYWPEDNKDDYQQISLDHSFTVNEGSPNPQDSAATNSKQIPDGVATNSPAKPEGKTIPGFTSGLVVFGILVVAQFIRKR